MSDAIDNVSEQTTSPKPLTWLVGNVRHASGWILVSVSAGFAGGLLLILQAGLLSRIIHGALFGRSVTHDPESAFSGVGRRDCPACRSGMGKGSLRILCRGPVFAGKSAWP